MGFTYGVMSGSRGAAPSRPLLGGGITDDTLPHTAASIPTARDLVRPQLTDERFSIKCIAARQSRAFSTTRAGGH